MRIDILTLFPEMFGCVLGSSILKRAAEPVADPADPARVREPVVSYHLRDMREYTQDKHSKVDQPPYGGGPGMVIQCQPVWDAVMAAEAEDDRPTTRVLMTPKGRPLNQPIVQELAEKPRLLILAGHYEGFDERVLDRLRDEGGLEEISIGDYVLSGGELPAMVLIDAIVRLQPGVLGHEQSAHYDSFSPGAAGLLDHPHYTRPRDWAGRAVPDVLLSGNHAKISQWRREEARRRTAERRPDLLGDAEDS
ncbi:MAG: tRNA (guanosine(37)-N1)-methyltransferase TrmD [Phycisphaeraceae bacterium]